MNKKISLAILCASIFIAKSSQPISTAAKPAEKKSEHEQINIKVFNRTKLFAHSVEGKQIEASLKESGTKLDKEIKSLEQEIEKDIKEFQGRARTLDADTLEKDQEKIISKKQQLELKVESARKRFNNSVNAEFTKFNSKIQGNVLEVAKSKNWDIVAVQETGEIVYASERVDVTDDLVKAMDDKFKKEKAKTAPIAPAKK